MTGVEDRLREALALLEQRAPKIATTTQFIESEAPRRYRRWVWPLVSAAAVCVIVGAVMLLSHTGASHSPAAHRAETGEPMPNPNATSCLQNPSARSGIDTSLVPKSPTSVTICRYPAGSFRPLPISTTTSDTSELVAALDALPTSAEPANGACRARYPGALPARGTYTLHFHYATGPDVEVNVLPECRPSVNNTALQADDPSTVLPVLEHLVGSKTLVIRYAITDTGMNRHIRGRTIARAIGSTFACLAWITNTGSHGPATSYEVHLDVPEARAARDKSTVRALVKDAHVFIASAAELRSPPLGGNVTPASC